MDIKTIKAVADGCERGKFAAKGFIEELNKASVGVLRGSTYEISDFRWPHPVEVGVTDVGSEAYDVSFRYEIACEIEVLKARLRILEFRLDAKAGDVLSPEIEARELSRR